ncbi:MAG: adenylate/guanylate cyclase domain-containing protein [Acidimicrobiales bacterium]
MHPAAHTETEGGLRVVRAFAFIDLCGFTDFVDARGDREAVVELVTLRSAVREVAPLFGVRVDKWLGDGVMLVSPEDEGVVAAVLAIQDRFGRDGRLALRAGIATGPVILLEGDDYVGRAVNLASRLCDHAAPGQVLAAEDGLIVPEGVEVVDHALVAVRGMATDVVAVALAATQPPTAGRALRSIVGDLTRPVRGLRAR